MNTAPPSSRRNFIGRALLAWFTIVLAPMVYGLLQYILPPVIRERVIESLRVSRLSEIPPKSAKVFRLNKKPVIVVNAGDGQLRAFSAVCTHLGCIVEYRGEEQRFRCNCHGSVFDQGGKNISGPAPRPLAPFRVEVRRDDVYLSEA